MADDYIYHVPSSYIDESGNVVPIVSGPGGVESIGGVNVGGDGGESGGGPSDSPMIVPEIIIPKGATVTERMADGSPSAYEYEGITYYGPGSTMYDMGYRTADEYYTAMPMGGIGVHELSGKPAEENADGTIIIVDADGKPVVRYNVNQLKSAKAMQFNAGQGSIAEIVGDVDRWRYPVTDSEGHEHLLTPAQVEAYNKASSKEQYDWAKKVGLIPENAEYVATENGWAYRTGNKAAKEVPAALGPATAPSQATVAKQDAAIQRMAQAGFDPKANSYSLVDLTEFARKNPDGLQTLADAGFDAKTVESIRNYIDASDKAVAYLDKSVKPTGSGLSRSLGLSSAEISALERAMSDQGLKPKNGSYIVAYRQLDDDTKRQVAMRFESDVSKSNAFSAFAKDVENISRKNQALALMTAPIQPITSPIGKQLTLKQAKAQLATDYDTELKVLSGYKNANGTFNLAKLDKADADRKAKLLSDAGYKSMDDLKANLEYYNYATRVTPAEWATAGAVAGLDVLALGGGSLLGSGISRTLVTKGAQGAALGIFVPQQVQNWSQMSTTDRALAVAMDAFLLHGAMPAKVDTAVISGLRKIHVDERGSFRLPGTPDAVVDAIKTRQPLEESQAIELRGALKEVQDAIAEKSPYRLTDAARNLRGAAKAADVDMLVKYAEDIQESPHDYINGLESASKRAPEELTARMQRAEDIVGKANRELREIGPEDVGMSEKEFGEFLKERVRNPKLTVEDFQRTSVPTDWNSEVNRMLKDFNRNLKEQKALTGKARQQQLERSRAVFERIKSNLDIKAAKEQSARQKRAAEMEQVRRKLSEVAKKRNSKEFLEGQEKVRDLNKEIADHLREIKESARQRQQQIEQTRTATQTLTGAQAKEQTALALALRTRLQESLQNLEQEQTATETELKELTALAEATQTQTQPETATETETSTSPFAATETETEEQTKAEEETATREVTEPTTETPKPPKEPTTERPPKVEPPKPPPPEPPPPEPPQPPPPDEYKYRKLKKSVESDREDKEKRMAVLAAPDVIAWSQGALGQGDNKQPIGHYILGPYDKPRHVVLRGQLLTGENIHMQPGPREAYKSLVQLSGKAPASPVKLEGGAVDPTISSQNGRVKISFEPDRTNRKPQRHGQRTPSVEQPTNLAPDVVVSRGRRHIRLA